jgi:dihydroxyacetone kinase
VPFVETLGWAHDEGRPLAEAWAEAARSARTAADATADLRARLGRAKTHGDHSLGHADPGAVSFALLMACVADLRSAT